MRLVDFILEESITGELREKTKKGVLTEMVRSIAAAGCLDPGAVDSVVEALLAREEIGSTGIGQGVAIPHAKHPAVRRLLGAYGHTSTGIEFDALDHQPVRSIFLILWPDGVIGPHLEAIAQVSRALKTGNILERLKLTSNKKEILELFEAADRQTEART